MAGMFSDKVALVTGSGSGIGRATAQAFAQNGAKVVVADWSVEGGQETVSLIKAAGGDAAFVKVDVRNEDQVKAMVQFAVDTYGRLDYAHNNAGVDSYPPSRIINLALADWSRTIDINLTGVFLCLKYEMPVMINQGTGGAIVNTASTAAFSGILGGASYSASKHAVIGLTKSAALEGQKRGIRVNALCPGAVDTPLMAKIQADSAKVAAGQSNLRAGRMAQPEEMADAVMFMCSDKATYMTGAYLVVDGGQKA